MYDGHNGDYVAEYLKNKFDEKFVMKLMNDAGSIDRLKSIDTNSGIHWRTSDDSKSTRDSVRELDYDLLSKHILEVCYQISIIVYISFEYFLITYYYYIYTYAYYYI